LLAAARRLRPPLSVLAPVVIGLALIAGIASSSSAGSAAEAPRPPSLLDDAQMVVYYGTPRTSGLGVLGRWSATEAARQVQARAEAFDRLNGDRDVVPAMELIYGMVTAEAGPRGDHVAYLSDDEVQPYLDAAEELDQQVILDLQIGRNDPSSEIGRIAHLLEDPRVHVAIDPEYAVGPQGVPLQTLGRITGEELNEVQEAVRRIVDEHDLPPKMVIVHQFMDETIVGGEAIRRVDGVDLVLNMDAWGDVAAKKRMYEHFAAKPWAHNRSYNVFLQLDSAISSEEELLGLEPVPDVFMYQ
jgi:hypothetical protein